MFKIDSPIDTIFVDCFDTLFLRSCGPQIVVNRWLQFISEEYNLLFEDLKEMYQLSLRCGSDIIEEKSFKEVVHDVYCRIQYLKNIKSDEKHFYNQMLSKYIEVESNVLCVNSELYNDLRSYHTQGLRVYLITDFYMPKGFFEEILERFGIDFIDDIFVSSDYGKRKSTGNLYKIALKKIGLTPSQVVMIGDNEISDVKMAFKNGIKAIHYKRNGRNVDNHIKLDVLQIFNENLKQCPLANYSFSVTDFYIKLLNFIEKRGVKDLYFFSREGEFFKRVFDNILLSNGNSNVKTHYLLVSRVSTLLPSLRCDIDEETFSTLKASAENLSIEEFLHTLGIDNCDELLVHFAQKGMQTNKTIFGFFSSDVFISMRSDALFRGSYSRNVKTAKKNFEDYLNANGIRKDRTPIYIVDIGWKGTIQDNLYNFFDKQKEIIGLYYGLTKTSAFASTNRKVGLAFSDVPVKSKHFNDFAINYRILERVLQASHGSAKSYEDGNCITFSLKDKEQSLRAFVEPIQERMESNILMLFSELYEKNSEMEIDNLMAEMHRMYLLSYTRQLNNDIHYIDNLMLMNFSSSDTSAKSTRQLLSMFYHMPSVEKRNKLLKLLRLKHLGIIADFLSGIFYNNEKRILLGMEL